MKRAYRYISRCGRYYCAFCDYYKGTIVKAAKNLLPFAERTGSLRIMANLYNACNFDEFMKGLRWLASQDETCKGCRFGGGWSWWPDCPVRDCTIQRRIDFCYQCGDFPCAKLKKEPLLDPKRRIIKTNNQIKRMRIKNWLQMLEEKYGQQQMTAKRAKNKI